MEHRLDRILEYERQLAQHCADIRQRRDDFPHAPPVFQSEPHSLDGLVMPVAYVGDPNTLGDGPDGWEDDGLGEPQRLPHLLGAMALNAVARDVLARASAHEELPEPAIQVQDSPVPTFADSDGGDSMTLADLLVRDPMETGTFDQLIPPTEVDPRDPIAADIIEKMSEIDTCIRKASQCEDKLANHEFTRQYQSQLCGFINEFTQSLSLVQHQLNMAKDQNLTLFQVKMIQHSAIQVTLDIKAA